MLPLYSSQLRFPWGNGHSHLFTLTCTLVCAPHVVMFLVYYFYERQF